MDPLRCPHRLSTKLNCLGSTTSIPCAPLHKLHGDWRNKVLNGDILEPKPQPQQHQQRYFWDKLNKSTKLFFLQVLYMEHQSSRLQAMSQNTSLAQLLVIKKEGHSLFSHYNKLITLLTQSQPLKCSKLVATRFLNRQIQTVESLQRNVRTELGQLCIFDNIKKLFKDLTLRMARVRFQRKSYQSAQRPSPASMICKQRYFMVFTRVDSGRTSCGSGSS